MISTALIVVFCVGYLFIAIEHVIKINKAAIALVTGVTCWILCLAGTTHQHELFGHLLEQTADIAGILFFLMGAMTIVEIIDTHHGFDIVTSMLSASKKRALLWLVCISSFFLSAVLDNLTTTIVMVALLSKMIDKKEDLYLFIGMVIIAVNAGGAWSPIGDVTTTMLWIGGQITSLSIIKSLLLPSCVCLLIPLLIASATMKSGREEVKMPIAAKLTKKERHIGRFVFALGIGVLLFVPAFKTITHFPPFVGMLLGLGVVWILTEIIHRNKEEDDRHHHSVAHALQKIDLPSLLFFLGILLSIAALQQVGILTDVAAWLDKNIADINLTVIIIGFLSAIVDNVPLVAAAIKMYPLSQYGVDHHFWTFLSYCAGTGGSALIIGSAAGVAAMGIAKINFVWYLRKISLLAIAGYLAGAGCYLVQVHLF